MISSTLLNLIQKDELTNRFIKGTFLTFEKTSGKISSWKVIKLGTFHLFLRKIFGWIGAYKNTQTKYVLNELKNELRSIVTFDNQTTNISKILRVANKIIHLKATENESPCNVSDEVILSVANSTEKFKTTFSFYRNNQKAFEEMQRENVGFKIKSKDDHLSIRVDSKAITFLTKKRLGAGGFKKVKTAFDINREKPLARATMITAQPRNFFKNFFMKKVANHELKFLQSVKGNPACIQLESNFIYTSKNIEKMVMFLELAEGDLSSLMRKDLSDQQRLNIASQLIDILAALSQKNIWHRDIKPLNFLYFTHRESYKVVAADFGLAVPDRNLFAEKFPAGTYEYMAPENHRFFKLTNGKEGDIYSLGLVLLELLRKNNLYEKLMDLIQEMIHNDPKKRPSAEQIQKRFKSKNLLAN